MKKIILNDNNPKNNLLIKYFITLACNNRCPYCFMLPELNNKLKFNPDVFELFKTKINEINREKHFIRLELLGGDPLFIDEINRLKEIEKIMSEKRKALENKEKWLREYIKNFMVENNIKKIETTTHKFSISNSQGKLIVENEDLVDMKYKIIVPEHYEIDSEKLKSALKNGEEVSGAKIEKGFTLRIS